MKRHLLAMFVTAACLSAATSEAYELATHAELTYRAFTRSDLYATDASSVQQRLGLDRLDPVFPFAIPDPKEFEGQNGYYDNAPARPPALPAANYYRDIQLLEQLVYRQLLAQNYFAAPRGPFPLADQNIRQTLAAWLMRGSVREDDDGISITSSGPTLQFKIDEFRDYDPWDEIVRVLNHFYDPVHDKSLSVGGVVSGAKATDWALGMTNALSAQESEDTARRQHFGLRDFYNNLYWALTLQRDANSDGTRGAAERLADSTERKYRLATAFKSLGHVAHLLQDMAQPQHTRDDQHTALPGNILTIKKRLFEPYTDTRVTQDFSNLNYTSVVTDFFGSPPPQDWFPKAVFTGAQGEYPIPSFPHAIGFFTTRQPVDDNSTVPTRKGLADFSNRNFFTVGTLPESGRFPYPSNDVSTFTQVQVGDAMVIGNKRTTNFYFAQSVQDPLVPSFQDQLPPFAQGKVPLAAFSQLQDLADLTVMAATETSIDLTNYQVMADVNMPRAVGYSAGIMNFALRGQLEVAAPADRVVAVLNQGAIHTMNSSGYPCASARPSDGCAIFGFQKVRVKLRNTTPVITDPVSGTSIAQGTGSINNSASVVAVARYHRNTCYKPDLSGERVQSYSATQTLIAEPVCTAGQTVRTDYQEISLSAPLNIVTGELDNLAAGAGIEKLFDFTADPIPVNATDLFIQVGYRGPLGAEASSLAVGLLDVREPAFETFWNNSDYFWTGSSWLAQTSAFPNQAVRTLYVCTGGFPVKLIYEFTGTTGSPAMQYPATSVNIAGAVRLGVVFPPPDSGSINKSVRGVPMSDLAPHLVQRSVGTKGQFRQADAEQVTAATLSIPTSTCNIALPTAPYWCYDPVQKRRGQIFGSIAQPFYLASGADTFPDVDANPALPVLAGVVFQSGGTVRFNTDTALATCPAGQTMPALDAPDQVVDGDEETGSIPASVE